MKITKMPLRLRLMYAAGIILSTAVPMLGRHYLSDFMRGFSSGLGLVLLIAVLVIQKKNGNPTCTKNPQQEAQ